MSSCSNKQIILHTRCVLGPLLYFFILSFFCTPILLIPLLFPSCSSYVAPQPHLIHFFVGLTLFSCLFLSLFFHYLISTEDERTHNILGACKAFLVSNWPMCLLLQSLPTKYIICLSCQIQISDRWEYELYCSFKDLVSVD